MIRFLNYTCIINLSWKHKVVLWLWFHFTCCWWFQQFFKFESSQKMVPRKVIMGNHTARASIWGEKAGHSGLFFSVPFGTPLFSVNATVFSSYFFLRNWQKIEFVLEKKSYQPGDLFSFSSSHTHSSYSTLTHTALLLLLLRLHNGFPCSIILIDPSKWVKSVTTVPALKTGDLDGGCWDPLTCM